MKMKKVLAIFSLVVMAALESCSTGNKVAFKEANNYFPRNDYEQTGVVKFVSQDEFDGAFGMATVMGENGRPTPIDFKNEFVVAKVFAETDVDTRIDKIALTAIEKNKLRLDYRQSDGDRLSYRIKPCFILIIDNKYRNCEIVDGGKSVRVEY